jgi:hypothetical protein
MTWAAWSTVQGMIGAIRDALLRWQGHLDEVTCWRKLYHEPYRPVGIVLELAGILREYVTNCLLVLF